MVSWNTEHLLTIKEAAGRLPGRVHEATIRRWIRGLRGVRLEITYIGGTIYTSVEALDQFFRAYTAKRTGAEIRPRRHTETLSVRERLALAHGI